MLGFDTGQVKLRCVYNKEFNLLDKIVQISLVNPKIL